MIAVDSELKDKSLGDAVRMVLHHYQSARSNVAQLHEANDQIQLMHKEMQVQAQEKEALKARRVGGRKGFRVCYCLG